MQENVFRERVTLPVRYPTDGVDTSVSPRKHANVAEQDSNELISVLETNRSRDNSHGQH
jgi:hypothetical protein